MHEVHNMLLTCDWMDKTLGSRLLNHLLKSLPRSAEDRSPQSKLSQDFLSLADQGLRVTLGGEPGTGRQLQRKGPTAHVAGHRENAPSHGPQLEMWRPWWWVVKPTYLTRPASVMYLIDMMRNKHVGRFCSSDHYCRCAMIYRSFLYFPSEVYFL